MRAAKREGLVVGSVPVGERDVIRSDGKRERLPYPRELVAIARACELRTGGQSLRKVADQLEAEGIVSRAGTKFAAAQVRAMCLSRGIA